jgi:hypothetical protein
MDFLAQFLLSVPLMASFPAKYTQGKGKAMDIAIYVMALVVVGVAGIVCITRIIGGK